MIVMMIPSAIDPNAEAPAIIGHQLRGGFPSDSVSSSASSGSASGAGGLGFAPRSDRSVSLNSIRLSQATPSGPAFGRFAGAGVPGSVAA